MSSPDTDSIIATIPKNATEEVRITLTSYNGHPLVDLRTFVEYRTTGESGPTKKGLTVAVALLPAIISGLQDAEAEARRRGLLP
ncbi:transcriptional coactivator p15/PC4 family protein [Azospirillum brasilense]|uniref:transcriptional coactivator p15/PC4 family protein n=1 Tax=Azospirillum brasilense TaxID=192 RepID=UPI000E68A643|nr:transcriptional coactivator p15/PC4 family protein [Azospirillum brasilense]NUB25735.1 hypothetical protein [Azospirillum brasilense]NUB33873.1 hypothetical protein [Azospirillum brasilense]RIW07753.1 hypothetical protein D2T81_02630 [Azospirillum brasilense]